jgi:hypothetical protein
MGIKEEEMGDFMDFILNDDKKKETKNPTKEDYEYCQRFNNKERGVCENIRKLRGWLGERDGLNMKDIINDMLYDHLEEEDLNSKYQKPLEILYKTGRVPDIEIDGDGNYFTKKLVRCRLVKDENGEWDYVNKLNTNYNDLAELLTSLFSKGNKIDELSKMNYLEIKKYLLKLKPKGVLKRLVKKYFTHIDLREFTNNTRMNTQEGDRVEDLTKKLLENEGYTTVYQGSNGDFIDMKYGIDLILEKGGEYYLTQVKSKSKTAQFSIEKPVYKYIDIFAGESPDKNGVMLYERNTDFKERFIAKDILQGNLNYLLNRLDRKK